MRALLILKDVKTNILIATIKYHSEKIDKCRSYP